MAVNRENTSWLQGRVMRGLQLVVLGVVAVLCYTQAAVWLPYRYIQLVGQGDIAAEKGVERWLRDWHRLHWLTRTDRIARYVLQSPWVEGVSVHKTFDGGLHIALDYKQPVLRSITGRYAVDSKGRMIHAAVTDDLLRLPVFEGEAHALKAAFSLWQRLSTWQHRLLSITVDEFSGWELLFDNKVTVRLGVKNLTPRLDLFLKVAKHWSLLDTVEEQIFDMRYNNSFSHKKIKQADLRDTTSLSR